MSVEDRLRSRAQSAPMVTHDEIMLEMHAAVGAGRVRPSDIARVLELPSPRVSEMLRGRRRIQQKEMPILAQFLGLTDANSNVRKIKRIGAVPAGQLRQAIEEATDTLEVAANLPQGVFALEVDGESMNLVAPYGADVVVDPNDKHLFAGDMYVVGDGSGAFTLKLFKQDPARLIPLSDDPAHAVIALGAEQVDIIGRVISVSLGAGALRKMAKQLSEA